MQETVSREKLNKEQDKQIHSNPITSSVPGKLLDNTDNSITEVEPVITPEEFNTLEKAEGRKKLFGFLKGMNKAKNSRNEESVSANDDGMERKLSDVLLKIEKLEGKFEMLESSGSEHGDRMSNISEEIGELRSMIFSREETLGGIESEFRAIKEATAEVRPEKIAKDLESYSKDLMKAQAQAELEKSKVEHLENELQKITEILDKIKSYENILEAAKDIKKQVDKINDSEKYTSRMAAKAEKIFGELDSRLMEFQKYKKEIDDAGEMIKDVVKSVDGLEIKIESMMPKDSFSKVKDETDTKIRDVDTRLKRLKDIVAELIERTYSHKSVQSSDIDAIKSSIHSEFQVDLAKRDASYEGLKENLEQKSEELERKLRDISGAVLSLENNARDVKENICDSRQAGITGKLSIGAKVDEITKIQEKEINEKISEVDQKFIGISSSIENLEDKLAYMKECIDHTDSGQSFKADLAGSQQEHSQGSHVVSSKSSFINMPQKSIPIKPESTKLPFLIASSQRSVRIAADIAAADKICGSLRDQLAKVDAHPTAVSAKNIPQSLNIVHKGGNIEKVEKTGEIERLKSLLEDMQKKIDADRTRGIDNSEDQTLVDNASLHLGMAELDLLDGNEVDSLQKIEKVKALLEK